MSKCDHKFVGSQVCLKCGKTALELANEAQDDKFRQGEELAKWIAERFTEVLTEASKKGDMRSSSGAVIGVVLGMGVGLAVSAGCPREVLETVFKKMLDKEYSS